MVPLPPRRTAFLPLSIVLDVSTLRRDCRNVSDNIPASEQSISLSGRLLLASPSLADGTFDHSVIMLFEHSATSGAHGIIINHPTGTTVGDLLKGTAFKPLAHLPVHRGGPLSSGELSFSAFSLSGKTGIRHRTHISIEAAAVLVAKKNHIIRATIGQFPTYPVYG